MKALTRTRSFGLLAGVTLSLLVLASRPAHAQTTSTPATTAGSILFLSLSPRLDATYRTNLLDLAHAVATADLRQRLNPAFLRKFNVIVIDQTVQAGAQYDIFGQSALAYWDNLDLVWDALRDGAGVLIYPNLNDIGGSLSVGFNQDMKPFGLSILQASVVDFARSVYGWNAYGTNAYTWTEAVAEHPATRGVKRVYYPGGNARWDDCYLAPPLVVDSNWTVLVRGMPGSMAGVCTASRWSPIEGSEGKGDPILAAVRAVGKGRLAALSISPNYTHRCGYARLESRSIGEASVGIIDGVILEKGDGQIASDTGRLVMQLYDWLGGDSAAAGLGGYRNGDPVDVVEEAGITNYQPVLDVETMAMPPSWKHRATQVWRGSGAADYPELADPVVPGDIRFFKGLVGPRTRLSDGRGTVEEYARAARQVGYAMLAFTETFEKLSAAGYAQLVSECERNTTDDLVCLPGFDIMDPWGNHFLVIAAPFYPRKQWLSEDGKRLTQPPCINLCYGNHMVVAHRTTQGTVPNERLKHYQGFTVYTYRDGALVEDASSNYAWQAESASVPHPVVVHELFSPGEVAAAARAGYQQILPSDTPANAAGYFRVGLAHYFDAPSRHLLSEGPLATAWIGLPKDAGPASENRDLLRVDIAVTNDLPLASVELRDGFRTVRRWLPVTDTFSVTTFFRHSQQRGLYVVARDQRGRGMLTSVLRTVPARYHFRCSDRQNWLGHVGAWYTGQHLPFSLNVSLPVQGSDEGSGIFTRTRGTCMAPKLNYPYSSPDVVVIRTVLDEKYTQALREDVSADARPSFPSEPSTVYAGTVTTYNFTGRRLAQCTALADYDLTLKRDVTPAVAPDTGLFPAVGQLRASSLLWVKDGQIRSDTNALTTAAVMDVPPFGLAGGYVPLQPGFRVAARTFGMAAAVGSNGTLKAGTRLQGRFLISSRGAGVMGRFDQSTISDETAWMTQLGFLGETPYALSLSQGKTDRPSFPVRVLPEEGLLEGRVTQVCTNMLFDVPLEFSGMNPNWPVGIWQEGADRVSFTGVFEGRSWPRLDVTRRGRFVAGQLVTASDPAAVIEVVAWTRDRVKLDVNNPTREPMSLALRTARIPGFRSLRKTVEIAAAASRFVEDR